MKKYIFLLLLFLYSIGIHAQSQTASVLQDSLYLQNPTLYLSKLDSTKFSTGVLIDRAYYDSIILQSNGKDIITTISENDWYKMYRSIFQSSSNKDLFITIDTMLFINKSFYQHANIYSIGLINYDFNRISQNAILEGKFIKNGDFLLENSTENLYSTNKIFAVSCLTPNVYGDIITFQFFDVFNFTNVKEQILETLEIDFDNKAGYLQVPLNSSISVGYDSDVSGFLQIKARAIYRNIITNEIDTIYSNSTIYRTASNSVPLPDDVVNNNSLLKSSNIDLCVTLHDGKEKCINMHDKKGFYPEVLYESIVFNYKKLNTETNQYISETVEIPTVTNGSSAIEYHILYSYQNTEKKQLRKPFIVTDGFDPDNLRDYYQTIPQSPNGDILKFDKDYRGLYQLINGDPSPWSTGEPSAMLIPKLLSAGYDLVIVNFLYGAGDIPSNAMNFQYFLQTVINSDTYRDNKTEEAIIVGPSMGGIITRYALTTMEKEKVYPYVKTWFSFDSPNQGAYIPLALQEATSFLSDLHTLWGLWGLIDTEASERGVKKLNSTAARQMLLYHYTATTDRGMPTAEFNNLYKILDSKGYPTFSKNYAISNGGLTKLYEKADEQQIIKFKSALDWLYANGWSNSNTSKYDVSTIFIGSKGGGGNDVDNLATRYQIGYENAPGGWNAALYSLNKNSGNIRNWDFNDDIPNDVGSKPFFKSCFMVTASAFGIKVTNENIYKNWTEFTTVGITEPNKITTPFDVLYGMQENEEHVRISEQTGIDIIKYLNQDNTNFTKPFVRPGPSNSINIQGKVAYVATETHTFAGNSNTMVFASTSDINVVAGKQISLKPGFSIKTGAKCSMKISNEQTNTILKSQTINTEHQIVDYTKESPYLHTVYKYSENLNEANKQNTIQVRVFPTTCENSINIYSNNIECIAPLQIEFVNAVGINVYSKTIQSNTTSLVSVSNLTNGWYMCVVKQNNKVIFTQNIIKK